MKNKKKNKKKKCSSSECSMCVGMILIAQAARVPVAEATAMNSFWHHSSPVTDRIFVAGPPSGKVDTLHFCLFVYLRRAWLTTLVNFSFQFLSW